MGALVSCFLITMILICFFHRHKIKKEEGVSAAAYNAFADIMTTKIKSYGFPDIELSTKKDWEEFIDNFPHTTNVFLEFCKREKIQLKAWQEEMILDAIQKEEERILKAIGGN